MLLMQKPKPSLIGELEFVFGRYFWARRTALSYQGVSELALYILRMAVLRKRAYLLRVRESTRRPKSDVTKAVKFLESSELGKWKHSKADYRQHYVKATARGRKVLSTIDERVEATLVPLLGIKQRSDLDSFLRLLHKANSVLPGSELPRDYVRATSSSQEWPSPAFAPYDPEPKHWEVEEDMYDFDDE